MKKNIQPSTSQSLKMRKISLNIKWPPCANNSHQQKNGTPFQNRCFAENGTPFQNRSFAEQWKGTFNRALLRARKWEGTFNRALRLVFSSILACNSRCQCPSQKAKSKARHQPMSMHKIVPNAFLHSFEWFVFAYAFVMLYLVRAAGTWEYENVQTVRLCRRIRDPYSHILISENMRI